MPSTSGSTRYPKVRLRPTRYVGFVFAVAAIITVGLLHRSALAEPFTLVALGDTQIYVQSDELNLGFEAQTQWIAQNAAAENIKFVSQLGDLVSNGGNGLVGDENQPEWDRANRAMSTLDVNTAEFPEGIPWGVAVGNHELDTVDVLGSGYTKYQENFGPTTTGRFAGKSWFGGVSSNEVNTYQYFNDGARQYMMLHLECDVPDAPAPFDAVAWGQGIIDANPGVPTILSTHVYQGTNHGPPNNPYLPGPGRNSQLQIFDKLVRNNSQVFMVLSGHTGQEMHAVKQNAAGLPVFELVQDYAPRANGGDGWIRLFRFDEANDEIRVETYTPGVPANPNPRYETDANSQFTLNMDWGVRFDGETPVVPVDPPEPPTSIIDDFETDTSANYVLSQSSNTGGTFNVGGGTLNLTPGGANTVAVMLNDGANYMTPGSRWAVDVNDDGNSFMQVSTIPGQPDGTSSFGFRLRRDTGGFRIHRYSSAAGSGIVGGFLDNPSGALTMRIDRTSATDFSFYYDTPTADPVLLGSASLPDVAAIDDLYVGVQAFTSTGTPTFHFDNLQADTIEVPDSLSFQQGVDGYAGTEDTFIEFDAGRRDNDNGANPQARVLGLSLDRKSDYLVRFDDIFGSSRFSARSR